jgi:hypothetical protein
MGQSLGSKRTAYPLMGPRNMSCWWLPGCIFGARVDVRIHSSLGKGGVLPLLSLTIQPPCTCWDCMQHVL